MEYLELLVLLQHLAVGGTALAGLSYFFFGSESLSDFLQHELKEWKLRTTLIWITGSFAFGYAVEDFAKNIIDSDKGVWSWTVVPDPKNHPKTYRLTYLDTIVAESLINPFFSADQTERLNTLFDRGETEDDHVPIIRWGQASLAERMYDLFYDKTRSPQEQRYLAALVYDYAFQDAMHNEGKWIKVSKKDLHELNDKVLPVYYEAINHDLKEHTYADILSRI
jgi:hypothetical protein